MSASPLPDCDPPERDPAPAAPRLPAGTCDAHLHVFGPHARYPLYAQRNYTPHACSLAQYRQVMAALGTARAVLVQPSVYGTDQSLLLDTLRAAGPAFRGVAVPRAGVTPRELEDMHAAGVRGIRLNLINPQVVDIGETLALLRDVAAWGWHLQVFMDAHQHAPALADLCARASTPVVVDHFGRLPPDTTGGTLFELLRDGACWVKLSAPYRVSRQSAPHDDLRPLVHRLVQANAQRLVWGSDWPHTEQHAGTPSAASLAALLHAWLPDAALLQQVCVSNPATLYQFV